MKEIFSHFYLHHFLPLIWLHCKLLLVGLCAHSGGKMVVQGCTQGNMPTQCVRQNSGDGFWTKMCICSTDKCNK